jgi:UDP-glucose 4-epimerase
MKNALITGGAGFVGSHLADSLLAKGYRVIAIDDLSTGSIMNIEHLKSHPSFTYVIEDMMEKSLLAELVDQVDVIFHLAAAVGVRLIVESPVRTLETNIGATELLLQMAVKKKKKVLITSTSEVYGKSQKVPFNEDDDLVMGATTRGRWSYACSKAIDEFLALAYYREKGLPTVIVRLFNTVGPRQTGTYGMVVPRFVECALANQPISIFGDGSQSRCFGYVGDVVEALVRLMEHPQAVGEIFNLGSKEEISIVELAKFVKEVLNSQSELKFLSYEEAYGAGFEDMQRRVPDLTKAGGLISYRPTTSLREIILLVAEHMQEQKKARVAVGTGQ